MFARINDTRIFFDVVGEELNSVTAQLKPKPTLILIHGGLGFDHGYLRPAFDMLAIDFHLIYLDLRGQGRSDAVPIESITLEQCADDVKGLCDYLGIEKAFFLGHSAGGYIAQILALEYPKLIQGLILVNTGSGHKFTYSEKMGEVEPELKSRAPESVMNVMARLFNPEQYSEGTTEGRRRMHTEYLSKVGPYYCAPDNMPMFGRIMAYTRPTFRVMDHFVGHLMPYYDVGDKIKAIKAPTLVTSGAYDWVITPLKSRWIAEHIPKARFVLFRHSGHFPFIEEQEHFEQIVHDFITEHAQ
ncbi:alpha/beta hydrolase [Pantoea sp. Al-1710]|uniref:Alpha/beta hydrolase n=1 Tax=Candidatus Pantoea communis TaxID=2608354 RepID=A0ABX0RLC2_9GAMM|nr:MULTISPECIES: alpha/beta hydrolase [Pantoea]NIG13031.1 alpha/beta hydrolase [Pantoea sp. Cy-640]NIG17268.1 alpha/beta hydrolase [Pantoea communis]